MAALRLRERSFTMAFIKRIFSAIIAFIISLVSLPFSFMPSETDTDFPVDGENMTFTCHSSGNELVFDVNAETGWFNYYALKYTSDSYISGEITYGGGFGEEKSEAFFLEPAENGVFYSFIDGVLARKKAKNIISVKVTSKQKSDFDFSLLGVYAFNRQIPDREIFISDSRFKIGIDLNWGGALSVLEDLDSSVEAVKKDGRIYVDTRASEKYGTKAVSTSVNLINRHDPGRLVQQSYYGASDIEGYENGAFSTNDKWPYNPVQGGNKYGDSSKPVDLRVSENSIYVKCRPMDWAMDAARISQSYMEAVYTLEDGALKVNCRFTDYSGYAETKRGQELPAFYCIEPLNRFVYYGGNAPWSGDTLSAEPDLPFWAGSNKRKFKAAENWAAFTGEDENSFGIGVFSPLRNVFVPGVFKRGETVLKDPSVDDPTSYFAISDSITFRSFSPFEYEYYITTGSADEIRNTFKEIAEKTSVY